MQPEQLVDATVIRTSAKKFPQPERTLILGWNRQAITIIRELNNYVSKGSQVHIVADASDAEQIIAEEWVNLVNLLVTFKKGDSSSRRTLDSLNCHTYHHIIILSYANRKKIQEADARTIFTLLHLRDLADHMGHPFTMVSQVLDVRNRELVNVTRADDFVVSDKLNSLMLSQVSENKDLSNVFEDLFRSEGSEVYLKPASDYVELRKPVNFYTVVESARRRGEIAIGCRLLSRFDEDALEQGVIVNPEKSKLITFFEEDKIIVLAEDDHCDISYMIHGIVSSLHLPGNHHLPCLTFKLSLSYFNPISFVRASALSCHCMIFIRRMSGGFFTECMLKFRRLARSENLRYFFFEICCLCLELFIGTVLIVLVDMINAIHFFRMRLDNWPYFRDLLVGQCQVLGHDLHLLGNVR